MNYPPFCDIICIMAVGEEEERVSEKINDISKKFADFAKGNSAVSDIIGPVAAPIAKIKNNYRYRLLAKSQDIDAVMDFLQRIYEEHERGRNCVMLSIDINPTNMY